MDEGSRKTALVIGAVAAAAGILVASAILLRRRGGGPPARSVSEVLQDCRSKLGDIQRHLTDISRSALQNPALET